MVVPYKRLMVDTVRYALGLRIDCSEWFNDMEDPATIVFISVDRLSRSFFNYIGRMSWKGLLCKIFIDECDLVVTAHRWRTKVVKLSELQDIGIPLVVLTATALLYIESDFESTLSSTMTTSWNRASTARRTTQYAVNESIADGKLMEEKVGRSKNVTVQLKYRERMVSYYRLKSSCEELVGEPDCGLFYTGNPNDLKALKKRLTKGGMIVAMAWPRTRDSTPG
jgi:superfamily II DNA helicase RecQ